MRKKPLTFEEFKLAKDEQFKKEREKGVLIKMKDIGREGKIVFRRLDWVFIKQSNLLDKTFIIEKLRKEKCEDEISYPESWKVGDIEYRICYYIVGKIGKRKNEWTWGQFCPFIPQGDLQSVFEAGIELLNKKQ